MSAPASSSDLSTYTSSTAKASTLVDFLHGIEASLEVSSRVSGDLRVHLTVPDPPADVDSTSGNSVRDLLARILRMARSSATTLADVEVILTGMNNSVPSIETKDDEAYIDSIAGQIHEASSYVDMANSTVSRIEGHLSGSALAGTTLSSAEAGLMGNLSGFNLDVLGLQESVLRVATILGTPSGLL